MRERNLDQKMEDIAHYVADRILGNEEVGKELNDAFKTLTTYWSTATKLDKVEGNEDTTKGGSFGAMKVRIAAAGDKAA